MNEIDSLPLTMPRLLAWAAARAPERIALEEAGLQLDYAALDAVSYTHLRAHETVLDLVCRLLLEKKKIHIITSNSTAQ